MSAGTMQPEAVESALMLRDYIAVHAPIHHGTALQAYGYEPHLDLKGDRAKFFAVWAALRYEFADAMLAARAQSRPADDLPARAEGGEA